MLDSYWLQEGTLQKTSWSRCWRTWKVKVLQSLSLIPPRNKSRCWWQVASPMAWNFFRYVTFKAATLKACSTKREAMKKEETTQKAATEIAKEAKAILDNPHHKSCWGLPDEARSSFRWSKKWQIFNRATCVCVLVLFVQKNSTNKIQHWVGCCQFFFIDAKRMAVKENWTSLVQSVIYLQCTRLVWFSLTVILFVSITT